MIRVIIVDDELNSREFLDQLFKRYFQNKIIVLAKCENVDEAFLAIEKFNPDIVYLDIQMPHKNGFELLKSLKNIDFDVVFTTAYAEFGIDAVKIQALDYLLKPLSYPDVLQSIQKFELKNNKIIQQKKIMLLLDNLDIGNSKFSKVAFQTETGVELVMLNRILYCEADNNYTNIFLLDGKKLVVSKTLKLIEEMLPENIFKRIHRTYLVNINFICRFNKVNEFFVELTNGQTLPVSVRKKDEFLNEIFPKK